MSEIIKSISLNNKNTKINHLSFKGLCYYIHLTNLYGNTASKAA